MTTQPTTTNEALEPVMRAQQWLADYDAGRLTASDLYTRCLLKDLLVIIGSRVSVPIVAPVVDLSLYSELIHIAAELARGNGFLSTCAEDMNPRLKRADILKTAERQEERLKDWAYRVRRVADKLSPAPASTVAPQQSDDRTRCASCEHEFCKECYDLDECCKCDTEMPPRTVAERLAQHEHIEVIEGVLGGVTPLVSRRRISVHHILGYLYNGESIHYIAENYQLASEAIKDAIVFARDVYDDAINSALRTPAPASPATLRDEAETYFVHAKTCVSCGPEGFCAEALRLYNASTTTTTPPSTLAKAATDEIVKGWFWHLPERDQHRARVNITAIIERCLSAGENEDGKLG